MGKSKAVNRIAKPAIDIVDAEIVGEDPQPMTEILVLEGDSPIFDRLVHERGVDPLDPQAIDAIARRAVAQEQEALFV